MIAHGALLLNRVYPQPKRERSAFRAKKHWRPAFAGRQNQTQGVEARYANGVTVISRVMEGLFANIVITLAAGDTKLWCR
jgi:hypothetical protein